MIPEDIAVKEAINRKDAVVNTHPGSKPSRAYKEIAAKIMNIEYDSRKDKNSLLDRVFRNLRRR